MEKKERDQQRVAGAYREPGDVADYSSAEESDTQEQPGEIVGGMYVRKDDALAKENSSQREVSPEGPVKTGKNEYWPSPDGQINPDAENRRTRDDRTPPEKRPRKEVA